MCTLADGAGGLILKAASQAVRLLMLGSVILWTMSEADVFSAGREVDHSVMTGDRFPADFTDPATCGGCHQRQFEEWTGTAHALALRDPLYQGELNKAFRSAGRTVTGLCDGCHSPAGIATGETATPGITGLGPVALAGVSCDICHSISDLGRPAAPTDGPGNGSIVLSPGEDRQGANVLVKHGSSTPTDGCGKGFHACRESELFTRSELCAGCHQRYQQETGFPLVSTYAEWQRSPYAQKGIQCQDCHMVETATFLRTADTGTRPERSEYRHYFSGANYFLFLLAGDEARKAGDAKQAAIADRNYRMAIERLQAAADLELFPVYRRGTLAEVKVRVTNRRAGHDLPTSYTVMRQLWLEVTARDASGAVVLSSGGFEGPGMLEPETRLFNSDGRDAGGQAVTESWLVTAFSRQDTIPPKGYKDAYFGVAAVKKPGPVAVEARLRYRTADQKVVRKLLRELPEDISLENRYGISSMIAVPIVDMAVRTAVFESSKR